MFHQDGWFFNRNEDGSVSIFKNPNSAPDSTSVPMITITPHVWASIVSSVSANGEHDGRYYEALEFHGLPR